MWQQVHKIINEASSRIATGIVNFLPGVVVLLVILAVSVLLAFVARYVILRALTSLDFDRHVRQAGLSAHTDWSVTRSPSLLIARTVQWTFLVLGLLIGLTALDATMPQQFALSIFGYFPHLVAAALILIVGGLLARFVARAVLIGAVNMQIQSARVLSLTAKWLLFMIAAAMALDDIGIGRSVLLLAFGILFGGIVLAIAIAVGLGTKDVVSRAIERQLREPVKPEDTLDHV
jgi:hypothetical protein